MIKRIKKNTVTKSTSARKSRRPMTSSNKLSREQPKRKYKTQQTKYKQIQDFYPLLQHPEKYVGTNKLITLRSSYEIQYAIRLDNSDEVLEWSSEDIVIWYQYPLNESHRYFTDFYIKMKNGKEYVIEVKPIHETREPKKGKNEAAYNRALFTYEKNCAKWKAAKEYCANERLKGRNLWFRLLTETDLIKPEII